MGLQLTASKTALLLQCPRPFAGSTEIDRSQDEPGEAARYGSAFHAVMASGFGGPLAYPSDTLEKFGLQPTKLAIEGLVAHMAAARDCLKRWMSGENPLDRKFCVVGVEVKAALLTSGDILDDSQVIFDEETHIYRKGHLSPADILVAGAADLLLESTEKRSKDRLRVVLDYKTGSHGDFAKPANLPQMRVLGMLFKAHQVAILDTPALGIPAVYVSDMRPEDQAPDRAIVEEIEGALRLAEDPRGPMLRTGPECKFCPARFDCPAKTGDLVKNTAHLAGVSSRALQQAASQGALIPTPDVAGRYHQLRAELNRLEKLALEEIRAMVEAGEEIVRPDGKTLRLEMKSYETISKKSIMDALGPEKGNRMLDTLRKAGALKTQEREELWAR